MCYKTLLRKIIAATGVLIWMCAIAHAQESVLYSTDFDGVDGSQPEHWEVLSPASGSNMLYLYDNNYAVDHRSITTRDTIVSQYRNPEAANWRNYVVEVTASYRVEPDSAADRQALIGLIGRASGTTTNFYTVDFWADQSWPANEGPGGRFRIYRFGGGGNTQLAAVDGIVPRPVDGLPMPMEMTVTIRLMMIGSTIVATLLDDQNEVLAQLSVQDEGHAAGYPGVRPVVRDSLVRYHSFRVYEPLDSGEARVAQNIRIDPALELELPTARGYVYEVQRQDGELGWQSAVDPIVGTGQVVNHLVSTRTTAGSDYRVLRSGNILEEGSVLYETDFDGPDFEVPDGWDQRTGSLVFFSLYNNEYVADWVFGEETFLALSAVDGPEAAEWTDYLVEAEASYAAADAGDNWHAYPTVFARSGPTIGQYYMAQFLPEYEWSEGQGGVFRIYRIGGAGNRSLAEAKGFLTGDGPPREMDVKVQFAVVGDTLTAFLLDGEGNELASVWTEDPHHVKGTAGVRPGLKNAAIHYKSFRVIDLSDLAAEEIVEDVQFHSAIEVSYEGPLGYSFQLQQTEDLSLWENIGSPVLGDDQEVSVLLSAQGASRRFYRAITLE